MSVNNMTFEQIATVLNAVNEQATGAGAIDMVNTSDFVSVAQTVLKAGYDPVINAITQVIGRNIFSNRPYNRKFKGLEMDRSRWGAITRKFSPVDLVAENAIRFTMDDGDHPDMFEVNKPDILQTNFYGQNVFDIQLRSIFRDQLDSAFRGPEQFGEFYAMITQNFNDVREQTIENMSRMTLSNMIAGKIAQAAGGNNTGVIYLIDEYNSATGSSVTDQTVFSDANFNSFARWLAGFVETLAGRMSERSGEYQTQITGKTINRHTPLEDLRVYLYAPLFNMIKTRVMTDAFNQDNLKIADTEMVNYWQSIQTPDTINVTPVYMDVDGTLETADSEIEQAGVVGVLFDRDAMGINIKSEWEATSPFEARGGYWNPWYHMDVQYTNDYTEKCAVLLLDSAE